MTGLRVLFAILIAVAPAAVPAHAQDPPKPFPISAITDRPAPDPGGRDRPAEIQVGAYLNSIQDINLQNYTYELDLYVWMRWSDEYLSQTPQMEVMNSADAWGLVTSPTYDEPRRLDDGTLLQVTRYQGRFYNPMRLADYPFDTQELVAAFEDVELATNQALYVPDDQPLVLRPGIDLPGYNLLSPRADFMQTHYPTDFGADGAGAGSYARITLAVPIDRPAASYAVKLLLPVLLVTASAGLVFLIASRHVDSRVALAITALLTLVALQFTANQTLPDVEYLTMIDWFFLISYLFVIVALGVAVLNSRRDHSLDADGNERDDGRYRAEDRRLAAVWLPAYLVAISVVTGAYIMLA